MINSLKSKIKIFLGIDQPAGPYSSLKVPEITEHPNEEFASKWIIPFYLGNPVTNDDFKDSYLKVHNGVNNELITKLLSFSNWRPRLVGGYFAAINRSDYHCDHIGKLLLRSDMCYSGIGYAMALASINSEESISYLCQYLSHYLSRKDLWYDQGQVMGALIYLDSINETKNADQFTDSWFRFVKNKKNWDLDEFTKNFRRFMKSIESINKEANRVASAR